MRYPPFCLLFLLGYACAEAPSAGNETPARRKESILVVEPLTRIRATYQQTEAQLAAGDLRIDSLVYSCTERGGTIYAYYAHEELRKLRHEHYYGDHGGQGEHYYFDDAELLFTFFEVSSWSFTDPPSDLVYNGNNGPPTVDKFLQQRDYYHNGERIQRLFKAYEQYSWEPPVNPDTILNLHAGTVLEPIASPQLLLTQFAASTVDCESF